MAQIGFRLDYMELLNWGTFHNKIWRLQPEGNNSLLTGAIGSGKSTVVDALTSLLVPHHKIVFNKAAGAEGKERNLLSYIKGNYGTISEETERKGKAIKSLSHRYKDSNDATFTVLLANFKNEHYGSNVTLAQVFWIENEKTQKLLIISQKPLTIAQYFTKIENGAELRKRLKQHDFIQCFDDNFSKYSQAFRQLFGMNSEKAIELFYQTVSMKSVSSLTTFVREQMLEATDIKNQIETLKKRFDDLNKAHIAVQDARKQKEILDPLKNLHKQYQEIEIRIQELNQILQAATGFFAIQKIDLLQEELRLLEGKLNQTSNQLATIEEQLRGKRKSENQLNNDIENNGGARLKQIALEIEQREKIKNQKKERYNSYTVLSGFCELPTPSTDQTFYRNYKAAEEKIEDLRQAQEQLMAQYGDSAGQKTELDKKITAENQELVSLKSRASQLPMGILNIRSQIVADLGVSEEEIPFAGELLRVKDSEKEWEGALERLLGGFGTSMLVPEKHYKTISHYINSRRLTDEKGKGIRFEYFKVPHNFKAVVTDAIIPEDSVLNKLDIKNDTPLYDWLENELFKRFNLRCVSVEDFQKQPDVITKEGQFKMGSQRHIKDDRRNLWDRLNFVLGWSNKEKIRAYETLIAELQQKQKDIDTKIRQLKTETNNNQTLQTKLNQLLLYKNWSDINWQDETKAIAELQNERNNLEKSNDVLKTLQTQLAQVLQEIESLQLAQREKIEYIGVLKADIRKYSEDLEQCNSIKTGVLAAEIETVYPKINALLAEMNARTSLRNMDNVQKQLHNRLAGKDGEKDRLNAQIRKIESDSIKVMKNYKHQFPAESSELSEELEAMGEYMKIWEKIVKEGLPAHEARFKKMLNETTINDIVAFDNKLDMQEKAIRAKIETINEHLHQIDYNKGTYIKLLADKAADKDIRDFKNDLKACYSNILGNGDAYNEDRFLNVQLILNRFRSNESKEIDWTNKVTDVRNWFVFNASERYMEDDAEREFYAGTSGKSGGQKEKLAYTILASALAYQFGLGHNTRSNNKSFRFVVIDEAFGRGDDESTQFGLGLFKKLDLQLLIVTPLQKIHVIENFINSVHYVSKDGDESNLQYMSIEDYKAEKEIYNSLIMSEEDDDNA